MRRFTPLLVAGAALVAMACGDTTAPTEATADAKSFAAGGYARKSNANPNGKGPKQDIPAGSKQLFTIPAAGGAVSIGAFTVTFPANAVCEARAGYGKRFWGEPCATLDRDVTLEAAFWVEDGELYVEFLKDLRFDPNKVVTIGVPVEQLSTTPGDAEFLYWSRDVKKGRQFFSELDANPHVVGGNFVRRIWHFSGYVVGSGRCENPGEDGSCEGGAGE